MLDIGNSLDTVFRDSPVNIRGFNQLKLPGTKSIIAKSLEMDFRFVLTNKLAEVVHPLGLDFFS